MRLLPERFRTGRRPAGLFVVVACLVAESVIIVGAAIGFRLHGYRSLLALLWVLPGIALGIWAMELFERWRGRRFGLFTGKLVFLFVFLLGIALGDWFQEATR